MHGLTAALLFLGLLATACGDGGPRAQGRLSVVASVYPLAWLAEQVAPEADLTPLSAGGLEAHDLELTPGQRRAIQTAAVVLFVGDIAYQPQVEAAVASAPGRVVSLSEVAGPQRLLATGPGAPAHEEGGSDAAGDEVGDPPGPGDAVVDPHIWFDVEVMADAAIEAGEAFATADPDGAEAYRANAQALRAELSALGADLGEALGAACRHGEAIVSHQAYGYLLEPFGLGQHGITGIDPEAGASSGELGRLVRRIEAEGFEYVLAEPVEGRAEAETVAREAGVKLLEVLPLDAVSPEQADAGFIDLVSDQAERFATALGCRSS